jgi:tetratricopeptide (TPR) repeat protein
MSALLVLSLVLLVLLVWARRHLSMPGVLASVLTQRFGLVLGAVAGLALACKLWLAATTYGTNDVYAYEQFATWARYLGSGIYRNAWDFNHPPSMIPVLRALDGLANASGVFFPFWLRLLPTLADAGTLWLVYRMAKPRLGESRTRWGLLLLAGSPALLLVSGFHGNTDSVMMFFLVLSVYLTERRQSDLPAGVAFGLAACVKLVPIIALPALLLYRGDWRGRLQFCCGAAGVIAACWIPWMLPDMKQAVTQVLGYRGMYGHWGLSWLASHFFARDELPNVVLRSAGAYLLLAAVVTLSFKMSRLASKPTLFAQLGCVFSLFLAASNAFGVQYLAWLAPWATGLALGPVAFYTLASGAFLLVVYNYWSEGMPWYLADSNRIGDYQGHADYFQLLCWVSVLLLFWNAWTRISRRPGALSYFDFAPRVLRRGMAVALAVVVIVPCLLQVRKDNTRSTRAATDRITPIVARQYLNLSSVLLRAGRNDDGIEVARRATVLAPAHPAGWNNLAAGYAGRSEWDAAIAAAEQAVRLDPKFQLARNNLAWARQEKAKLQNVRASTSLAPL